MPPEPLSWLVASVSAAGPGSEPVTVPTARSDRGHRGVERVLVHRHVAVGRRNEPRVRQVDRQRRRRGVAVAVGDRVHEHVGRARRRHHVRVAVIAVASRPRSASACRSCRQPQAPDPADTGVVVSLPAATPTTPPPARRRTVRPEHVGGAVGQHVAGDDRALDPRCRCSPVAVGTSSTMLTVMVPVAVLPLASVTT